MEHSFPILNIWVAEGDNLPTLLTNYFSKFPIKCFDKQFYYAGADGEAEIKSAISTIQKNKIPFDAVILPPGSNAQIGDWLNPATEKFPNGFSAVTTQIKSAQLKSVIWIAPLVCSKNSAVFRNHPDWILKDKAGKPLKLEMDSDWGNIYALNFKQLKVQEYLIGVIHTLTEKWGFDGIYADFLFVACLTKEAQQTNGQLMNEFVDFINTQVGEKILIAGGVPLGSSLAQMNYVEVGNVAFDQKKNPWWNIFGKQVYEGMRDDCSNFIERRHLDQVAFGNVLNIFTEKGKLASLNEQQELSIVRAQALLGSITFTSRSLSQTSRTYLERLTQAAQLQNAKIQQFIILGNGLFEIQFEISGKNGLAWFNFTEVERRFTKDTFVAELKPYESSISLY